MRNPFLLFFIGVISLSLVSCLDIEQPPSTLEILEQDQLLIKNYLDENNIVAAQDSVFGIYYVMVKEGNGDSPDLPQSVVNVDYVGSILGTETVIDSNDSIEFPLNRLILGWQVLIPYMKEGGEMTMYLPRSFAYGSDLLEFDVVLNEVVGQ